MIEYQFKEEQDFAIHYAKVLERPVILSILDRGCVSTEEEARALSIFFWDMVDKTIEIEKQGATKKQVDTYIFGMRKLINNNRAGFFY